MKVLILGASLNPSRYAYMALNDLVDRAHSVIGVGNREGELRGVKIVKSLPIDSDIHTVTLYLGPQNQEPYYNYLKDLRPKRIIFNPGTENPNFERELSNLGVEVLRACTLVMLRTNQF